MKAKAFLKMKAFWKSVLWLGLAFILIYNFITMMFDYGGFHFAQFFQDRTENGNWLRFVLAQLMGGFLYGFILAFGQFHVKQKKS
ncbi:hypothetical protein C7S20_09615 [Christiangramia fulva]|uniref:Uncharacterized protein n=1 Tax=Christiangramia fulva TaxID=2126553 RepID=A0A2R3Z5G7_9FLAO|nr:hypothetical protein [Christiangramia fulva]AVR45505.1 hypothetical protein C7S20_09615 [Christiangramia fulva]